MVCDEVKNPSVSFAWGGGPCDSTFTCSPMDELKHLEKCNKEGISRGRTPMSQKDPSTVDEFQYARKNAKTTNRFFHPLNRVGLGLSI